MAVQGVAAVVPVEKDAEIEYTDTHENAAELSDVNLVQWWCCDGAVTAHCGWPTATFEKGIVRVCRPGMRTVVV